MRHVGIRGMFCALLATAVLLGGCGGEQRPSAKPPRDGFHYNGKTNEGHRMTFSAYGLGIPLFEARFDCDGTIATTSLEGIPVRRTHGRYRFRISAHSLVAYADGAVDENGAIIVSGTFARSARTATGHVEVTTPRCSGDRVLWRARAQPEPVR